MKKYDKSDGFCQVTLRIPPALYKELRLMVAKKQLARGEYTSINTGVIECIEEALEKEGSGCLLDIWDKKK